MIFIYIQNIIVGERKLIPFRVILFSEEFGEVFKVFPIRPEVSIPKKMYASNKVDRLEILEREPFCNSADELIDLFQGKKLVFSEKQQFNLLKAQFRNIGYNFNLTPRILWSSDKNSIRNLEEITKLIRQEHPINSENFAKQFLQFMYNVATQQKEQLEDYKAKDLANKAFDFSTYKRSAGVYFFLNAEAEVIYVGKAKNIRKRLQSHFSSTSNANTIDYRKVANIDVLYTGNDIIAQLVETENIKNLKPLFNSQQIVDPEPYIITLGTTSKGISRIKITRKQFEDSLPEKYFNRKSVLASLEAFCEKNNLCRKHCGLEKVKGPCSNYTKMSMLCVCAGGEPVRQYNKRFQVAFDEFQKKTDRKIYKLKGRTSTEDAFVYELNGIYEGYGYIDKSISISNYNDILGHLIKQKNNYDTTRILSSLAKTHPKNDIFHI